jgi:hypothetical protein
MKRKVYGGLGQACEAVIGIAQGGDVALTGTVSKVFTEHVDVPVTHQPEGVCQEPIALRKREPFYAGVRITFGTKQSARGNGKDANIPLRLPKEPFPGKAETPPSDPDPVPEELGVPTGLAVRPGHPGEPQSEFAIFWYDGAAYSCRPFCDGIQNLA